jgi:hypothetical protein
LPKSVHDYSYDHVHDNENDSLVIEDLDVVVLVGVDGFSSQKG